MGSLKAITFEGFTAEELLALPIEEVDEYVLCDDALVIQVGSCSLLGKFSVDDCRLILELAQIDGGGEGVLPALSVLARKFAAARELSEIEWRVHAVHCANPNLKFRRVLERRGFEVVTLQGIGDVYHQITDVEPVLK